MLSPKKGGCIGWTRFHGTIRSVYGTFFKDPLDNSFEIFSCNDPGTSHVTNGKGFPQLCDLCLGQPVTRLRCQFKQKRQDLPFGIQE
jgi:hypothetical protein